MKPCTIVLIICLWLIPFPIHPEPRESGIDKEAGQKYYKEGNTLYDAKEYEKAMDEYSWAIHNNPDEPAYYNAKGLALYQLKRYEEAMIWFEKANSYKTSAVYLMNIGNCYYMLQKNKEAVEYYNKALGIDPGYTDVYHSRGLAYYFLEQYQQSIFDFNQVITKKPKDAVLYYYRARNWNKLGETDLALRDYSTAIEMEPSNPVYYDYRSVFYYWQKKHDLSLQDNDAYLKLKKDNKYVYRLRGINYFLLGDPEKARNDFLSAISLDPLDDYARFLIVSSYLAQDKFDEAVDVSQRYLKLIKTDSRPALEYYNMTVVLEYLALSAKGLHKDAGAALDRMVTQGADAYVLTVKDYLAGKIPETEFIDRIALKNKTLPNALAGLLYHYTRNGSKAQPYLAWVNEHGRPSVFLYEPAMHVFRQVSALPAPQALIRSVGMDPNPVKPGTPANLKAQFNRASGKNPLSLAWYIYQGTELLVGPIGLEIKTDTEEQLIQTPFTIPTMAEPGEYRLVLRIKSKDIDEESGAVFRIE